MGKKIEEILAEANLNESQVKALVGAIREARDLEVAGLRELHAKELVTLTESREGVIRQLITDSATKITELEERVQVNARRISATISPSCAVGIDLDTGGTLCFTVTQTDGSGIVELSKPDSDAIKAWFKTLQESAKKCLNDSKIPDNSEAEMIEEAVSSALAEMGANLEEALAVVTPAIRNARRAAVSNTILASISEAVSPILLAQKATPINESAEYQELFKQNAELKESVEKLTGTLSEKSKLLDEQARQDHIRRRDALVEELTEGLALTTKERVKILVESAGHMELDEAKDFIKMVVDTAKLNKEGGPASTTKVQKGEDLNESSRIASYVDKL